MSGSRCFPATGGDFGSPAVPPILAPSCGAFANAEKARPFHLGANIRASSRAMGAPVTRWSGPAPPEAIPGGGGAARQCPLRGTVRLSRADRDGNRRSRLLHERELSLRGAQRRRNLAVRAGKERDMAILQDKVVLVTGAGAGIGRATALAMAAEGAVLAAADIDRGAAERTSADCNEGRTGGNSRRAIAIEADWGDVAGLERKVETAGGWRG